MISAKVLPMPYPTALPRTAIGKSLAVCFHFCDDITGYLGSCIAVFVEIPKDPGFGTAGTGGFGGFISLACVR